MRKHNTYLHLWNEWEGLRYTKLMHESNLSSTAMTTNLLPRESKNGTPKVVATMIDLLCLGSGGVLVYLLIPRTEEWTPPQVQIIPIGCLKLPKSVLLCLPCLVLSCEKNHRKSQLPSSYNNSACLKYKETVEFVEPFSISRKIAPRLQPWQIISSWVTTLNSRWQFMCSLLSLPL